MTELHVILPSSRLLSHVYVGFLVVFRRPPLPPATVAMVAVGGGVDGAGMYRVLPVISSSCTDIVTSLPVYRLAYSSSTYSGLF